MFQAGDMIIYGRMGVCRVEGIEDREGQPYYRLVTLYQKCTILTPVNGRIFMRLVLTREEADALIDSIPSVHVAPVECRAVRELTERYLDSMNTCDAAELLAMTMSIYAKKKRAEEDNRKFGAVDERFLREGEAVLYAELGVSLGIPPKEVPKYLRRRLAGKTGDGHVRAAPEDTRDSV